MRRERLDKLKKIRKEMFYLMAYSTHFYIWLHGIRHMVMDHRYNEKKPAAATVGAILSD